MAEATVNPDREAVRAFLADPGRPVAMETSPLLAALGARLAGHDPTRRELVMTFAPQPLFRQGAGVVQGGAVSAMLDFVMGFAGMATAAAGQSITTTSLTTSFYGPARAAEYVARGRIEKPGRRVMFAAAELEGEGRIVAAATSVLLVVEG